MKNKQITFYVILFAIVLSSCGKQKSIQGNTPTSVSVKSEIQEIKDLKIGKKSIVEFELINTGDSPLLINDVKSSCGCTVPAWEKRPVESGKRTKIKVEIVPEHSGFFQKTVTVFSNAENSPVKLTVRGTVN